jgi:lipopolysaccharide/colanic/teichoic acid biosynthesis glycosyltransferase
MGKAGALIYRIRDTERPMPVKQQGRVEAHITTTTGHPRRKTRELRQTSITDQANPIVSSVSVSYKSKTWADSEVKLRIGPKQVTDRFAYEFLKRLFDLTFGSILLLIALPIVIIAAIAIKLESKGSPFFIQTRLGRHGRPFRIFKLRGMFKDARTRFPEYYDYSNRQNLDFCFHHEIDPRVTKAGKICRKTSIDELPNLWNVVRGDMSLVGPRPEIPEVLALYGGYLEEYLSVKPGVTCLSKITGRDKLTKRETVETDIEYIRNRKFTLDLRILFITIRSVLLRRDVF